MLGVLAVWRLTAQGGLHGPVERRAWRAGLVGAWMTALSLNLAIQWGCWRFYFDPMQRDRSLFAVPMLLLPFLAAQWLPAGWVVGRSARGPDALRRPTGPGKMTPPSDDHA